MAEIVFACGVPSLWESPEDEGKNFVVSYDVCPHCVVLTPLPPGNAGSNEEADPLGEVLYFPGDGKFRVPSLLPPLPLLLCSQCIP